MKCGQLIEYNLRNITQNVVEKLFPDTFLKNQNWPYLWINILKFYIFYFYCLQVEDYRNWLKLIWQPVAFISNKVFLKNKKRPGTSLPALFFAWFLKKKHFSCYIILSDQISSLVAFTSWDIGQYVYCNSLLSWLASLR